MKWREGWRFVLVRHGEQCVIMVGTSLMPLWSVHSLDSARCVSLCFEVHLDTDFRYIYCIADSSIAIQAPCCAEFGQGSDPILLDRVACTGTESHLANCSHRGIGVHFCSHFEDAGVRCIGEYKCCTVLHYDAFTTVSAAQREREFNPHK